MWLLFQCYWFFIFSNISESIFRWREKKNPFRMCELFRDQINHTIPIRIIIAPGMDSSVESRWRKNWIFINFPAFLTLSLSFRCAKWIVSIQRFYYINLYLSTYGKWEKVRPNTFITSTVFFLLQLFHAVLFFDIFFFSSTKTSSIYL